MKRTLVAGIIAVCMHGFLLNARFEWINQKLPAKPKLGAVTMTLSSYHPPAPEPDMVFKEKPSSRKEQFLPPNPEAKTEPQKPEPKLPLEPKPRKDPAKPKKRIAPKPLLSEKKPPEPTAPFIRPRTPDPIRPADQQKEPEQDEKLVDLHTSLPSGGILKMGSETETEKGSKPAPEKIRESGIRLKEAVPIYRKNPPPPYPGMARRKGYEGTVLLDVLVDCNGEVCNVKVFQSSRHSILDKAAEDTVKAWLFEPGKKGDIPVEMWVRVPIRFQLKH